MDKNAVTGLVLIGILLVRFSFLSRPNEEQIAAQKRYHDPVTVVQQQEEALKAKTETALANEKEETVAGSASLLFNATQGKEAFTTIQNDLTEIALDNKGGRVYSALLKDYMGQDKEPVVLLNGGDASANFSFYNKKSTLRTKDFYFKAVNKTDSSVTVRLAVDSTSYIDFIYTLKPDNYLMSFMIRVADIGGKLVVTTNYVDIPWSQRARQVERGYTYENRLADLTYEYTGNDVDSLSAGKDDEESAPKRLDRIAFRNQFFSPVFIAGQNLERTTVGSKMKKQRSGYIRDYSTEMGTFFNPAGKQPTDVYFYFGPNHYKTLTALDKGRGKKQELNNLVYLGQPLTRWINKWVTTSVFGWLSSWGSGMGVVLLLLTIMVKVMVFPATWKIYMSSTKIRVLKPKIGEINRKYPKQGDATKRQQEAMGPYSRYGVSPMDDCLPTLAQFLILMALFMFVLSAIELRRQSFLQADDLSTYDAFIAFPFHIPFLDNYPSLFCLLMATTSILDTKYTIQQQDTDAQPQMAAVEQVMYLMPIMLLFVLNSYPSGLNYYYPIPTSISVVTMIMLCRTADENKLLADLEAKKKGPKQMKKTGFAARLEAIQKQQEQMAKERANKQNKR